MTRLYAIVLLSVFMFHIVLPLLPWMEYYIDYEYIVENLCEQKDEAVNTCNGNCHLAKEIKKAAPETDQNDQETPVNNGTQKINFEVLAVNLLRLNKITPHNKIHYESAPADYSYLFHTFCFRPPNTHV